MGRDTIIMLAWPETPAIQVGSWYEPIMKLFGFNKNGYYTAGHSALVLVDRLSGTLKYFDFGRYHTPAKYGRVRNCDTDPNLTISVKALFDSKNQIINKEQILLYLSKQKDFHGYGKMFASFYSGIDFIKAYEFAKKQQNNGAILYGPFAYRGNNCSRFTSRVYRAGVRSCYKKLQTIIPFSLTQTPLGNILIAAENNIFYRVENSYIKVFAANIFTFITHWTLPPLKAAQLLFDKKTLSIEDQEVLSNSLTVK